MESSQPISLCRSRGGCERLVKSHRVQPYFITFLVLAAIALIVVGSLRLSDVQGLGTISRSQAIAMIASGGSLLGAGAVFAVLAQYLCKKDKALSEREVYKQACIKQIESWMDKGTHVAINLDYLVDRSASHINHEIASEISSELKQYFEEHYKIHLSFEFDDLGHRHVFIN